MRNLTEVSLKNQSLVWYFIVMSVIGGIFAYINLGRMENPAFTIKDMIVSAAWPGATAEQMALQVTDKLEKKLQDIQGLDFLESETQPGITMIYVELREDFPVEKVQQAWKDVRNFCEDIKEDLPEGVYGPYYDDKFDDVFGSIYALTGDGFNYEELRQQAENIRQMLLDVPSVQKVELIGVQDEKIYVEIEQAKLAELGINPQLIMATLQSQNQITATGKVTTATDNVFLRVTGVFENLDDIKNLPINADGRIFRLADIAKVERKFIEPAETKMFFNGEPAIGIAVSMEDGGNILTLGENLKEFIGNVQTELPVGMEIHQVSDQPQIVEDSINEFVETLIIAIVIILAVSFISLGMRSGLVVAGCIPLVLTGVFVLMYATGIDLHKISLGALIIALGLLVDDAIIAVEMMSVKLEAGLQRFDAACYAFEATAKPMLTGTLITCAGFIPVAFADGMASEFCSSLFPVITMALGLSWIVSVMVAPLYGYYLIKVDVHKDDTGKINPYDSKFYKVFRKVLEWFLSHRILVLSATVAIFAVSIYMFDYVKSEFFPPSQRPEIIVDLTLPNGSSMAATQTEADNFSKFLDTNKDLISNYSCYIGEGAPRFVLTIDPILPKDNYAQFVIAATDIDAREKLTAAIQNELDSNFPNVRGHLSFIPMGPPADYPVMIEVSGQDIDKVKNIAAEVAAIADKNSNTVNVHLDWYEKSKVVHLELDQDKLRAMGVTSQDVSQMLYTEITGATAAQFYTGDRMIDIDLRIAPVDRQNLSQLKNLPIYLENFGYVPLEQIAKISFAAEDGFIKRKNLKPSILVCADIKGGTSVDTAEEVFDATQELRNNLPFGYSIEAAGDLEDSDESTEFLLEPVPAMIFIIMTLLMLQLRNATQMFLTILTAPLGLIGVCFAMLITDMALGFVASLGVLALSGMIIRNSVILIDQIQKHLEDGEKPYDAIIDSAILRFRPIMLTAAAAILGMIPLMSSNLWGPMAVAIAGGLMVATVLTLLVLPTMYATIYRISKDDNNSPIPNIDAD